MKQFFPQALRCLVAAWAVALWSLSTTSAQRTDSLSAKTVDIIAPNVGPVTLNGYMYYLADDGKTGYELWRSNGTPAGTSLVKDIRPGRASAFVSDSSFTYFGRDNSSTTFAFTAQRVKDALRAFRPFVHTATNTLYFWADNGTNGVELWKSNGTEAGTQLVADLIPGSFSTGTQSDILSNGYLGGTNGGSTGGYYYSPTLAIKQNKLLFWTSNVRDYIWETDGTTVGTREISHRATKYINTSLSSPIVVNGRTFIQTYLYNKGKYYYSLVQDDGKTTTPLIINADGYIDVLSADKRGLVYAIDNNDAASRQYTYTVYRRDSVTAKVSLLKTIAMARPTTGTRSQGAYRVSQSTGEAWVRAYDYTPAQQSGKNINELWRIDLATDSVRQVRRFEETVTFTSNTTRYEKGSEALYDWFSAAAGQLFVSASADSVGLSRNRYTLHRFDAQTGRLQVLEDSMATYYFRQFSPDGKQFGPGGKALFLSRKGAKDATRLWITDGRQKQTVKTLGVYEFNPFLQQTDAGLVTVAYVYNRDKANKVLNYKVDVWKLDSTAAGTVRVGQANALPGGVGTVFSNGTDIYSNYGSMLKLSAPAPDSIRFIADIANFADLNRDGNYLGIINGRILARSTSGPLVAIDPKATPRKCLVSYESKTRASTYFNTKDLGYCPAKDSVVTLKQRLATYGSNTGEISRIYYKNYTWLRDSTTLQSGTSDSLKLRQQGQYTLTLRGIADGCVATDSWQVYYSTPTVSQIPKLTNDRKYLAAVITGGYPVNGNSGYYTGKWERTAADGGVSQASTETGFNAATGMRGVATAALEESVNNVYQPKYGTYTLKITDANSCSATGTYVYDDKSVIMGVATTFGSRNGSDVCAGSPVSYTTAVTGGKAPYTYRWIRNGAPVSGAMPATGLVTINSDMPTTDFNGNFSVEATDADGRKTYSNEVLYFVQAAPAVSVTATSLTIPSGQSVTLTANCTNYQYPTFAWAKDDAVVSGVASRTLAATQAGLYSVTVGSGVKLGCTAKASLRIGAGAGRMVSVTETPMASAQETKTVSQPKPVAAPSLVDAQQPSPLFMEGRQPELRVRPNPSDGPTRIEMILPQPSAIRGRVLTPQGNLIQQWQETQRVPGFDRTIDLTTQPTGVYIIQVEADGAIHTQKVIKK